MRFVTDITLPRDYQPVFPQQCIRCHDKPDSTIKILHNIQNPLRIFFMPFFMIFGWSRVEIPICHYCKFWFRLERYSRELVLWLAVLAAIFVIYPMFDGWSKTAQKIIGGALVLLAVSPYVLLETFWARIFDTNINSKTITYQFADDDYALDFEELNREHVIED